MFTLQKKVFRGWSPDRRRYIYGGAVHDRNDEWYIIPQSLTPIHVLKQSVGQSSCIQDDHGRTIFEGDTIRRDNGQAAIVKLGRFINHEWIDTGNQQIGREEYGWYLQPLDMPNVSVRFNPNAWFCCEVVPKSYWIPPYKLICTVQTGELDELQIDVFTGHRFFEFDRAHAITRAEQIAKDFEDLQVIVQSGDTWEPHIMLSAKKIPPHPVEAIRFRFSLPPRYKEHYNIVSRYDFWNILFTHYESPEIVFYPVRYHVER